VEVCVLCFKLLRRQAAVAHFKAAKQAAHGSALVLWYDTMRALRSEIDKARSLLRPSFTASPLAECCARPCPPSAVSSSR